MALRPRPTLALALLLLLLALSCLAAPAAKSSKMCARFPPGTDARPRPGDNGYEVRVTEVGKHRRLTHFKPGRTYQVVVRSRLPAVTFRNFYLTALSRGKAQPGPGAPTGNFVHVANPPVTANLGTCPGVVTTAYRTLMDRVSLRWTAPTFAKDCVLFRASVEKYPGIYFKDAGRLTQRVCPEYLYASDEGVPQQRPNDQPPAVKYCCACGTATYKMTFRGRWIRQLHPRDWPRNEGYVHWSNIIGATHSREYFIYYLGGMASAGVQSVCQFGDASALEGEFKSEAGSKILNIIKTRGVWDAKNMGESRTAIFAVNRTHHLMSMLTMLGPSPDWCTGISAQDLCRSDCTWIKKLVLNLYPWDAGVKKGNTYLPKKAELEKQQQPILPINANWPRGNPFTVEKGKMRPVATVTIERLSPRKDYQCDRKAMAAVQKLKATQNDGEEFGRPSKAGKNVDKVKSLAPNLQAMVPTMCFMTPWAAWSQCSVTCGSGSKTRTRRIERNLKPALCVHVKLKDRRRCTGFQRTCDYAKPCSTTAWSTWSPCNETCSNREGVSVRTRTFIRPKEAEKCGRTVKTQETRKCFFPCVDSITCSSPMVEGFRCFKPETRYYYNLRKKACLPFTYLGCKGSKNRFKSKADCHRVCDTAFDSMPDWQVKRLSSAQEDATRKKMLKSKGKTTRSCRQPMNEGHRCRRSKRRKNRARTQVRWYFNMKTRTCSRMQFKGCAGNGNNFKSVENCRTTCSKLLRRTGPVITGPPQDCEVGRWGPWGPCSEPCGGTRIRTRRVLRARLNGGRPCPKISEVGRCAPQRCRPCAYAKWSSWSSCTKTCDNGIRERTRSRLPTSPRQCTPVRPEFVQRDYCNNKPCPLNFFYFRKH